MFQKHVAVRRHPLRVLFTGYAPVHFVCFRPLYRRLTAAGVDVRLSGGIRTKTQTEILYDAPALYEPFGIDPDQILTVAEIEEMDFDLLFAANTKPIEPRSIGRRIQLFHGISFRNRAIRKEKVTPPDHYFMVGPYMLRAFRFRRLVRKGDPRVAKIGFPKTDPLVNGSLDRNEIVAQHEFSGYRPIVLYAPTGAAGNSMVHMGEELIRRLGQTGAYDLLIKPHDHSHDGVDWFERLAPLENDHTRLVRDPDAIPSLFVADLLITDASSVSYEFALLDRPMVFLDVPELLLAEIDRGGLLDLETWGRKGGLVARDPMDAIEAVAEGLAAPDRHSSVRQKMVRDLFYNPGTATEAALSWLGDHTALRIEQAEAWAE